MLQTKSSSMIRYIVVLTIFLSIGCVAKKKTMDPTQAKVAIARVMNMQEEAWSAGDIEQFMEGYWQSERLVFIGSRGLTYGWQKTLDNYKKGYPTKEDMGTLQFDIISLEELNPETFYMIGKYTLIKDKGNQSGHFTLIWKLINGRWRIVSDHSS